MRALVVTNMWPSAERPHWGAFVKSQAAHYPELSGVALRWRVFTDLAQSLLSTNEFVYID